MYYRINFKGECVETGNIFKKTPFIERTEHFLLDKFLIQSEQILITSKIKIILFVYDPSFKAYPGQIEQIYKIMHKLKEKNKKLYFFAKEYDEKALFLASICDKRIIPEGGIVAFLGFKYEFIFYKRLLDKQKIEIEVYRRGKYKGAADSFRLDKIDETQKEAYGIFLKRVYETFKTTITNNFNISKYTFENDIEGKFLDSKKAFELKLITDIKNLQSIIQQFEKQKIKKSKLHLHKDFFGKGTKIALLIFDGAIKDGKNSKNLLFGKSIGDDFFIKQINKIKKDKKIKGVILKINSPGGSALASDAIADELLKLKKEKTFVVVQSGVAASGGYYLSFPAEKIFTQITTLTGSIGVINMIFYIKEFAKQYGITNSILKEGEFADIFSLYKKRNEEEKKLIDQNIEKFYKIFVQKVAKNRNRSFDQIDNIAQGRIWSGYDAIDSGIVDEIGDIYSAIDYIKMKNNFKTVKIEIFPKLKESFFDKLLKLNYHESDYTNISSFNINAKNLEQKILMFFLDLILLNNNKNKYSVYYFLPDLFINDFKI